MGDLIKSPLNYTGGKFKLLPQILPLFPSEIETFVDLFCGGANVGINASAKHIIYNDYNQFLIGLYKTLKKNNYEVVKKRIENIIKKYELSDSTKNGYSYYGCESGNGLGSYNRQHYIALRADFNDRKHKDEEYYLMLFTLLLIKSGERW